MKKKSIILIILVLSFILSLYPAIYKNKNIDKKHFSALMWMKGTKEKYKVDVVFVKKAANIIFDEGQMLPHIIRNDRFLTLYLIDEKIENLNNIILKQVNPPIIKNNEKTDPDKWEIAAIWIMKIDLKK